MQPAVWPDETIATKLNYDVDPVLLDETFGSCVDAENGEMAEQHIDNDDVGDQFAALNIDGEPHASCKRKKKTNEQTQTFPI